MPSRTQRYIKRAQSRETATQRPASDRSQKNRELSRREISRLAKLFAKAPPAQIISYFDRIFGIPDDYVMPIPTNPETMPRTPENERILRELLERRATYLKNPQR